MARPILNIIQGDWVASPAWLDLPAMIRARSPVDSNQHCTLRVARGDVHKAALNRVRQPAFQFWSMLAGVAPPIPGLHLSVVDPDDGLTRLTDAHACFSGIRRPAAEDRSGERMLAYVLKPTNQFVYERRPPATFYSKLPVPDDLVLVAYARLDEPCAEAEIKGVVTHWQLVEADPRDSMLPEGFDSRYEKRLW